MARLLLKKFMDSVYQILDVEFNRKNGFRKGIGQYFRVAPQYAHVLVVQAQSAHGRIYNDWAEFKAENESSFN